MLFDIYRKSFQENSLSLYWGGETWHPVWDINTLYLYLFIICITWLFANICNKRKDFYCRQQNLNGGDFLNTLLYHPLFKISFILLLLFMSLRGARVGIDTIAYRISFEDATTIQNAFSGSTEPLYNLILFLLRSVFTNSQIPIFFFSALIITFVHNAIKQCYPFLNLTISLLAFVILYYFQSYNLVRITLASSFLLWNFKLLLQNNYKAFAIRIIIATLIHYSSIVSFLPLCILLLYRKSRTLSLIVFFIIVFFIGVLTNTLQDYVVVFNRYTSYVDSNESTSGIGMALFIDYLPCLYVTYYLLRHKIKGNWSDLMIVFTLSAFIVRLLAYHIGIAGRLHTHFMILTIILLPYWVSNIKRIDRRVYKVLYPMCLMWLLIRLHLYLNSYLLIDGIMPYYFVWK